MNHPQRSTAPAAERRFMFDEADIGSGEKTPAHKETEDMIRQIPPLPPSSQRSDTGKADEAPDDAKRPTGGA